MARKTRPTTAAGLTTVLRNELGALKVTQATTGEFLVTYPDGLPTHSGGVPMISGGLAERLVLAKHVLRERGFRAVWSKSGTTYPTLIVTPLKNWI